MADAATNATELRLVRLPEVVTMLGLSRPTIYRMIKAGKLPKPVKQGRTSSWRLTDLSAYINGLTSAS
ncbi:MAG: AlpA family phage regulatory protein [Devosia sp.]|nr:AlpA family phage regulatory protein [Devosia sp.]